MREGHQFFTGQFEVFGFQHVGDAEVALVQRLAVARPEFGQAGRSEQALLAARSREQDAALLEGFAYRGDTQGDLLGCQAGNAGAAQAHSRIFIAHRELAAGEDQGPGGKVDLVVTHHHEDFQGLGAVAQQQDGGGEAGGAAGGCR